MVIVFRVFRVFIRYFSEGSSGLGLVVSFLRVGYESSIRGLFRK